LKTQARQHQRQIDDGPDIAAHAVEVVVAYLGVNSPDYLLSVLACTAVEHVPSLSDYACVRVRPALLNYRWTEGEISHALRVQEPKGAAVDADRSSTSSTEHLHVTILLHGAEFEQIARRVVGMIQGDPVQTALYHTSSSMHLPSVLGCQQHHSELGGVGQGRSRTTSTYNDNGGGSGADDALILFTSGTSSSSGAKGVRLSHNSLIVQAMAKLCAPVSYDEQTNMVATTVPFFHVGGMSSALAVIMAGGTLTFPATEPAWQNNTCAPQRSPTSISFQPNCILGALYSDQASANTLVVVPAMVHSLISAAAAKVYRNVRLLLVGGQSLSESQLAQARLVFPNARIIQTYACTEAGSSISFAQLYPLHVGEEQSPPSTATESAFRPYGDYVGFAPAHIEMKVVFQEEKMEGESPPPPSSKSNAAASQLKIGIIATRGQHVMNGYWQRGNEALQHCPNRVGLTSNGWLMTNDRGHLDAEGRLYLSGRASDVIRSGGESIPANEVERAILSHPLVDTCAVFPLPDERFGETVCVALVLKVRASRVAPTKDTLAPHDLLADIKRHCSDHGLAPYKRPKRAFILPQLPTNSSGKVLKHKLVDTFSRATKGKVEELNKEVSSLLPLGRSRL